MLNRRKIKFIVSTLIGCLVITFNTTLALADKELSIGVAEFAPFKFKKDGKIVGSDTEIIEQVIRRMGYIPKIEMQPWKRVLYYGEEGTFAAIYSFTKSPQREKHFYFTDPISTIRPVFYKRKTDEISWNTLDDLKDYAVGACSGYNYHPVFMEAMKTKKFEVYLVTGRIPEFQLLGMLVKKRVDVIICEISLCNYHIKMNPQKFGNLDYIDKTIGAGRTFHLGFSKKYPGSKVLTKKLNAELAKFVAEGKRKAILNKYGIISSLN